MIVKTQKTRSKSHHLSYERKKSIAGYLFITPWIIGTVVFFLIPILQSVVYSFGKIVLEDTGYSVSLVGFKNYVKIFVEDAEFLPKAMIALRNMVLHTPMIVLFSLFIAILLNQRFVGRTAARVIFFLPVIIANGAVISIINGDVFSDIVMQGANSSQLFRSEFLNALLVESGLNQSIVNTLTSTVDSLFELIWKTGIQVLIFLAGLQTITPAMYEVAKIEGSTGWELFWKVTLPMISPMLLINVIYTIIDSFTDYSNIVMNYINTFTTNMKLELGSAMIWTYFIAIIAVLGVTYLFINKSVFYEV